jgi:hypothetical protein
MISAVRPFLVAALVAAVAAPVFGATYFVPSDAELIQKSDDIVIATGVKSEVGTNAHGGIVTRYTLRVEESLKGRLIAGDPLVLTENGGILDGRVKYIPGTPEYQPGVRYLLFTGTNEDFEPRTFGMAMGQFFFAEQHGRSLLLRAEVYGFDGNLGPHQERARDAQRFVEYIRGIVAQRVSPEPAYFVDADPEYRTQSDAITSLATRSSFLMASGGRAFRWSTPATSFVRSGSDANGSAAVNVAFGQWNSTATNINYSDGGQDNTAVAGLVHADGKNAILFNDPNGEINGFAGLGGISSGGAPYSLDGENFWDMLEVDVVIESGTMAQSCLNGVITHEFGHTLGFRHAAENPNQADAIMNWQVNCSFNGVLRPYDQDAASTVYGAGAVCNPPTIATQPQNKTVDVGATTSLSVVAGGSGPYTYQWFFGDSPNTANPVSGATSSSLSITPNSTGTGKYWVRVGHSCDSAVANSNTATVTATCTNPAITAQPGSVTITGGQSTQLIVGATGSGLSFQWFKGESGDRSQPLGSPSSSNKVTVSPAETTKYWVHITGACGVPVDSAAATVTVVPCAEITVNTPTATQGATQANYTLNVTASSTATPLTFGWFRGGTPGFGGTAIGSGPTVNVTVTAATNFWARVQNGCGRIEFSSLVTLAPCTLPTITTQPADRTINSGGTANLSIAFTAGATVKWYRGTVGDKTNQVGSTANITVGPLTATTQYWAEVSTSCGPVSSRQVTVNVIPLSELVPMLNGRFFVQVNYRNQFDNGKTGKLLGRSQFSTPLSETAVFTFGDQNVIELMVRVSDARPFDNHIHIFLGGLSDVEFSVVVTDSLTGIIHEYGKPANQLVGVIDRSTFPASNSLLDDGVDALMAQTAALSIAPTAEVSTIRLLNNRFEVRMHYRNQFTNPAGEGYMNARSIASSPTTETAVFFFDDNVGSAEWMVRFSDARPFANRIDMFHGGLSDVEFTIEVLDTKTGQRKEYHKAPFSLLGQVDRESYLP